MYLMTCFTNAWSGKKAIEELRQEKKEHSAQGGKQEETRKLESSTLADDVETRKSWMPVWDV